MPRLRKDSGPVAPVLVLFCTSALLLMGAGVAAHGSQVHSTSAWWPQLGYSAAHAAYNPIEDVISTANAGKLKELWSFDARTSISTSPAVGLGRVFVTGGEPAESGPTGGIPGRVFAVDAKTGRKAWSFVVPATGQSSAIMSSPAIFDGRIYVTTSCLEPGCPRSRVFALDAHTGRLEWTFRMRHRSQYQVSPTVSNGMVYAGDGLDVYALAPKTGRVIWRFTPEHRGQVDYPPTIEGGLAFLCYGASGKHGYEYCSALRPRSGKVVWRRAARNGDEPIVAHGVLYLLLGIDWGWGVGVWRARTGKHLWSHRFRFTTYGMRRSLAIANHIFAVDDNAGRYSVNRNNGDLTWYVHNGLQGAKPSEAEYSGPVVANGMVFDGGVYQCGLYAYGASTGRVLWTFGIRTYNFDASPAVTGEILYAGTLNGQLFAFGLS